ncbi:MAG TPA: c-type cytochrome [Caulobacteraceae bacterium]|jgi:cytochrome c2|nr:c-type cytochrome [Caulobacteraceae bacterium]
MSRVVGGALAASLVLAAGTLAGVAGAQSKAGDAGRGASIFNDRCSACHSLTENLQGPPLGGVVGRKAGSVSGADYSDAMKKSGIVWTPDKLDQFLADPDKMVPGTAMPPAIPDPVERQDVVAYLASVSSGAAH